MDERILKDRGMVVRHSAMEMAEHWILAITGFILLFSGFGELPMYKRYMVTQLPLLGWSGDYFIQLKIHYLAAMVFISAAIFHVIYHGMLGHRGLLPRKGDGKASLKTMLSFIGIGEEPPAGKYLAEQRLAYLYMAV
ncbi:MAG: cytochrome b/b6 domain-containing protein, partial [Smithellaceae bacterium]|nr:cytochrome b/b6 domain-containing protein [Smithellaceae bacterium]